MGFKKASPLSYYVKQLQEWHVLYSVLILVEEQEKVESLSK